MPDDFESDFEAAFTAAETGGDDGGFEVPTNANVWMGDDPEPSEVQPVEDGVESGVNAEGDPVVDTPVEGEQTLTDQVFDWATEKDKLVTITVAGEEIQVPLGEALNGYMRQSDYTKKTQLIAEEKKYADWARDMQRAFQTDPVGTIQYLQQALGVSAGGVETDPLAEVDPELRPVYERQQILEQQLRQQNEQLQAVEQERILNGVRAEIAAVKEEFPDFDATKVLPLAADRGLPIRDAYLLVEAQKMLDARRAEASAKARAAETARLEAAKRTANGKIATAGSGTRAIPGSPNPKDFTSFDQMLEYELEQAGV